MLYNGLCLVVDMALAAMQHPLLDRYRDALLLGSVREDVWYLPLVGAVVEQPAVTHFFGPAAPGGFFPFVSPGPRWKATRRYARAVAEHRRGRVAASLVQLGRVSHLLTDMACPVHVHRVVHDSDPYEWYVEASGHQLAAEPLPPAPEARSVRELIESLARFTARFPADETRSPHGRLLRRAGLRRPLPKDEVRAHAHAIIPHAAAHTVALFRLFLDETGVTSGDHPA